MGAARALDVLLRTLYIVLALCARAYTASRYIFRYEVKPGRSLDELPTELLLAIAETLDPRSSKAFSTLSRRFRTISLPLLFKTVTISFEPPENHMKCTLHGWFACGTVQRPCNGRKMYIPFETRLRQAIRYRNPQLLSRFCGAYCGRIAKMPLRGPLDSGADPAYAVTFLDPGEGDILLMAITEMGEVFKYTRTLCLSRPGAEHWNMLAPDIVKFAEDSLPKALSAMASLKTLRLEVGSELTDTDCGPPPSTSEFLHAACSTCYSVRPDIAIDVRLFYKHITTPHSSLPDIFGALSNISSFEIVFALDINYRLAFDAKKETACACTYSMYFSWMYNVTKKLIDRCPILEMKTNKQRGIKRHGRWVFIRLGQTEWSVTDEEAKRWVEDDNADEEDEDR